MSPLRTEAFHQRCNFQHLFPIRLVCLESSNFRGDLLAPAKPPGRFNQRPSDRLGTIHPRGLEARESSFGFFIKAYRYRPSHARHCITFCNTGLDSRTLGELGPGLTVAKGQLDGVGPSINAVA
jgi:hypothetical protein